MQVPTSLRLHADDQSFQGSEQGDSHDLEYPRRSHGTMLFQVRG